MVSKGSSDARAGAVLALSVSIDNGQFDINVSFEGQDVPQGDYSGSLSLNGFGRVRTELNSIINAAGRGGPEAQIIRNQLTGRLPGSIDEAIPNEFRQLSGTGINLDVRSPSPANVDQEWDFSGRYTPIPVPRGDALDQLGISPNLNRSFEIVARVRRDAIPFIRFDQFQSDITWETSVEIPLSVFTEDVSIQIGGNCLENFPEIERQIDELSARVSAPRSSIRSADTTISSIKDSIEQADQNARSALSADIGEIVSSLGQNRVEDMRREVSQISINTGDLRDLEGRYRDLRSRIQNTGACAEELLNELENRVGEIPDLLDRAGRLESEASRLRDLLGATGQVRCRVQFEAIARQVRRVEDDAGLGSDRIPTTFDRLEDAVSRVRSVRDDIQANIPADNRCRNEFEARLDRAESRFRRRLTDPAASGLDCEDVDQGVRTIVSNFEDRAREFTSQPFEDRRPAERSELLSDQTRVINTIRTNVDDLNPCKSQLLNRVRTAVSQVQGAEAISEFQLDCTDRFEGVARELDAFEEEVLALDAPVGPEEFQQVTEDGNRIIDLIEQSTEPETECREEFVERTRALVDRAERLGARVRITTDGQSESQQRREELLGDILGSLERLERQRERTEVELDADSGGEFLT